MVLPLASKKPVVRLRARLSYDGTDFLGWQRQPNSKNTVQGILEEKLTKIYNQKIAVVGSGRTDKGVHALNQWAHFDLPKNRDHSNLHYKLQRMTPESITIKQIEEASQDFHAQISAVSKCYFYRIQSGDHPNPFGRRFSWQRKTPLDMNYLQHLAKIICGEHDFSSFQSTGTPVSSTTRQVLISRWVIKNHGIFEYQIQGTGFLKQMVRNIVGTMVKMHDEKRPTDELSELILKKNRQLAPGPAPACGLFLSSVQYPSELDNKCRKL